MANADKQLYGGINVANVATDSKTNATATAAQAAPSAGNCLLITKILITMSAAPAAAVRALVQYGPGPTTLFGINIPATSLGKIEVDFGSHPILVPDGQAAQVVVPALGAAVVCDVDLFTVPSST